MRTVAIESYKRDALGGGRAHSWFVTNHAPKYVVGTRVVVFLNALSLCVFFVEPVGKKKLK